MIAPDPIDQIGDALSAALAPPMAEVISLRDAARRDPLRNCPMDVNGELVGPGMWKDTGFGDEIGLPPGCPVRPLGKIGDEFYFLNPLGEVHPLTASSSGKGPIDALFAGRSAYLEWAWPRFGRARKGELPPVMGYEADEARRTLFDACAYKGVFDDQDGIRGRGAWKAADGGLIYHQGLRVWIGDDRHAPGEINGHIYPARPRLPEPAAKREEPGAGSAGDLILEILRTWNWERPIDAYLMLGWIMTGLVGGALKVRPIVYLSGPEGSGKSTLQELVRGGPTCGHYGLMNGACVSTGNATQAGIYQAVKQDSVAVMIDENEAEADTRVADKLMKLARIAYTGDTMLRGGADHVGKQFRVMSSFLFSSIAIPAMDAQDQTRVVLLTLRELDKDAPEPDIDIKAVQVAGRQLLRRWHDGWTNFAAVLTVMRAALKEVDHDSRSADTFGTLAAACHMALHDGLPTEADLEFWKKALSAGDLVETADKQKTWKRCLMQMLRAQPEVYKGLTRRSVEDFLVAFKNTPGNIEDCYARLPHVGLALTFEKGALETWDNARLFVPANHPALNNLMSGTQWAGRAGAPGPWSGVLRQAPRDVWKPGKCGKGLDAKASGLFIDLAKALEL